MKYRIAIIIGALLILAGFIGQAILMYQTIGMVVILAIVPHWSLLFYLGIIPVIWGCLGGIMND